jgi:hypothetical protein
LVELAITSMWSTSGARVAYARTFAVATQSSRSIPLQKKYESSAVSRSIPRLGSLSTPESGDTIVAVSQEHHVDPILRRSGSLDLRHRALCELRRRHGAGVVDADGRTTDLAVGCEILDALGQRRVGAGGGHVGGNRARCEQRESAPRDHCCRETSSDGQCEPPEAVAISTPQTM